MNIHKDDLLFQYMQNRHGDAAEERYLKGGAIDAALVVDAAKRILRHEPTKVLEFASGYGRVTRHLKKLLPRATVIASDIHSDACDFIETQFDVSTYISSYDPDAVEIGSGYDFIFVLSLFSHLPHRTFGPWLVSLYDKLAPGGALLFTTHGDYARRKVFRAIDLNAEENGDGWTFRRRSDQPDLEVEEYGTMIVTPRYVTSLVEKLLPDAMVASFAAGRWLGLQDEWALIRSPE